MIKDTIQKNILVALKEKKQTELKVLRFILSEIKYAEINKQKEMTDEEVVAVLRRELNKRKESVEMFRNNNRPELVADEEKQIKVIETYLPVQMDDEELNKIIDETLAGIEDKSNIGKVIGMVMPKVKGKADGGKVARLIKQKLSGKNNL